eukprot:29905-Pelagococcus_subviridis.AAC.7
MLKPRDGIYSRSLALVSRVQLGARRRHPAAAHRDARAPTSRPRAHHEPRETFVKKSSPPHTPSLGPSPARFGRGVTRASGTASLLASGRHRRGAARETGAVDRRARAIA